jgi:enamine deaminase RidA (YjgF/YER057c/UK114 family)
MATFHTMTDGYIGDDLFESLSFSQIAISGSTVYLAGAAALKGSGDQVEVVGPDDLEAQVEFVLGVIERSLAKAGTTKANLVAWTLYTTRIDDLMKLMGTVATWLEGARPTSTTVEVSRLVDPGLLLEISAIAER